MNLGGDEENFLFEYKDENILNWWWINMFVLWFCSLTGKFFGNKNSLTINNLRFVPYWSEASRADQGLLECKCSNLMWTANKALTKLYIKLQQ